MVSGQLAPALWLFARCQFSEILSGLPSLVARKTNQRMIAREHILQQCLMSPLHHCRTAPRTL